MRPVRSFTVSVIGTMAAPNSSYPRTLPGWAPWSELSVAVAQSSTWLSNARHAAGQLPSGRRRLGRRGPLDPSTPSRSRSSCAAGPRRRRRGVHRRAADPRGARPSATAPTRPTSRAVTAAVEAAGAEVVSRRRGHPAGPGARHGRRAGRAVRHLAAAGRPTRCPARGAAAASCRCRRRSAGRRGRACSGSTTGRRRAPALRRCRPARRREQGLTPVQVAAAYDLPDGDGTGQTIAIIELGGGFGRVRPRHATSAVSACPRRRSPRSGSTARRTSRARTRTVPTARCCSTSRSPARSRPARTRRSTSRPTPTPASSTRSPRPRTPSRRRPP